jgi:hypothetical protein
VCVGRDVELAELAGAEARQREQVKLAARRQRAVGADRGEVHRRLVGTGKKGTTTRQERVGNVAQRSSSTTATTIMADGDDTATLWKVNRTIHEMVKDRVRCFFSPFVFSTRAKPL